MPPPNIMQRMLDWAFTPANAPRSKADIVTTAYAIYTTQGTFGETDNDERAYAWPADAYFVAEQLLKRHPEFVRVLEAKWGGLWPDQDRVLWFLAEWKGRCIGNVLMTGLAYHDFEAKA